MYDNNWLPYSYFIIPPTPFHELKFARLHQLWKEVTSFCLPAPYPPYSPLSLKCSSRNAENGIVFVSVIPMVAMRSRGSENMLGKEMDLENPLHKCDLNKQRKSMRVSSNYDFLVWFSLSEMMPTHQTTNDLVLMLNKGPEE